ncbi:glycosyltransferase [Jannaschia sp. 2305UL9-9]|uniref:glycosyltransferase n=1 Tax=Jannaschia sp. 2305UL9-9 TaxID=3121638 RepID=UPI0035275392
MGRPRIVHLVDDTTAGGVMRVLDHIMTAPPMGELADHSLQRIDRGKVSLAGMDADIVVSHLAVSWRAMPMLMALRLRHPNTPLVHVEHSYTEAFVALNVARKGRFATLLRLAYGLFNRVVAVSQAQGDWLVRSGAVPMAKLDVIRSCVDLSAFRAVPALATPPRVIGAIGRLDRQKGFDTLIRAFRNLPQTDIALHIYGEGDQEAALRALAGDDPRIRFMGFSADPVAAMAAVDIVAMSSAWEAYGLVAIEALAAGRGLLVNDIDGLVDHAPNGAQTVEGGTVAAWQRALADAVGDATPKAPSKPRSSQFLEDAFVAGWRDLTARLSPR